MIKVINKETCKKAIEEFAKDLLKRSDEICEDLKVEALNIQLEIEANEYATYTVEKIRNRKNGEFIFEKKVL